MKDRSQRWRKRKEYLQKKVATQNIFLSRWLERCFALYSNISLLLFPIHTGFYCLRCLHQILVSQIKLIFLYSQKIRKQNRKEEWKKVHICMHMHLCHIVANVKYFIFCSEYVQAIFLLLSGIVVIIIVLIFVFSTVNTKK